MSKKIIGKIIGGVVMKKIILMGVICGLMLSVSGCNTSDNKEKAVRYITEKKSVEKTETTTETKDYKKLINTVYAQLGNNDKKSVVNIDEAKVKKIDIKSEKNIATVYKGNIIKNLIMDCQSYTKYRPNETTGGIFVSWRRKEELPTGA